VGDSVRCFFNLVSPSEVIPDHDGVEVANLDDALAEAREALCEMRQEERSTTDGWIGWRLVVEDDLGTVLFSISLDRLAP
jgi:hypothetical protein